MDYSVKLLKSLTLGVNSDNKMIAVCKIETQLAWGLMPLVFQKSITLPTLDWNPQDLFDG